MEKKFRRKEKEVILNKDNNVIIMPEGEELTFNNLEILDEISRGANGIVFKCIEKFYNREVALKIWFKKGKNEVGNINRSIFEVKKHSKIKNDFFVEFYSAGEKCGYTYMFMEYIDGEPLESTLKRRLLSDDGAYEISMQILEALRIAHNKNIYHGDLHTKNILITKDGDMKIIDIGSSALSGKEKSKKRDCCLMKETIRAINPKFDEKFISGRIDEPQLLRLELKGALRLNILKKWLPNYSRVGDEGCPEMYFKSMTSLVSLIPTLEIEYIRKVFFDDIVINGEMKNSKYEKFITEVIYTTILRITKIFREHSELEAIPPESWEKNKNKKMNIEEKIKFLKILRTILLGTYIKLIEKNKFFEHELYLSLEEAENVLHSLFNKEQKIEDYFRIHYNNKLLIVTDKSIEINED